MHAELARLRELLKQRILVGKPGGGFFRAPRLDDESPRLLLAVEEDEELIRRRLHSKGDQTSLSDYKSS